MSILRRPVVLAVALAVIASFSSLASAVTWNPAAEIGPSPNQVCDNTSYGCDFAGVATGPNGTTTSAWLVNLGDGTWQVKAATRPPGATSFDAPLTVGDPFTPVDTYSYRYGAYPSVAIDSAGTTFVAWMDGTGGTPAIRVATRAANALSYTVQEVSDSGLGTVQSWPTIASSDSDQVTVVWAQGNKMFAATRAAGQNAFATQEDLGTHSYGGAYTYTRPLLAMAPDGTTTVAWYSKTRFTNYLLVTRTRPAGSATWLAAQTLSDVARPMASLAAGDDGTMAIAVQETGPYDVVAYVRAPGAATTFGNKAQASASGTNPDVAVDIDGNVHVAWSELPALKTARLQAGQSSFDTAVELVQPGGVSNDPTVQITASLDGSVTAVYEAEPDGANPSCYNNGDPGGVCAIQARTWPSGAAGYDTAVTLSGAGTLPNYGTMPAVAGGPGDLVTAVWPSTDRTGVAAAWTDWTPLTQRTLTVTKAGAGDGVVSSKLARIYCGGKCAAGFDDGSTVTLTATPDANSTFTGWSGGVCSGTSTCVVTMSAAKSVTATFSSLPQYALTVTTAGAGGGAVTSTPSGIDCGTTCSANFYDGTVVTLTATEIPGTSTFAGWSGGVCSGTNTTCDVTMSAAKSVTATFDRVQYALAVTKAGAGSGAVTSAPSGIDCGATCTANFDQASTVTLTAAPAAGSTFAGWSGAGCSGTSTCVVTMSAADSVTATFDRVPQSALAVTKAGAGSGTVTSAPSGIDCGSTCTADFDDGSTVTLTAAPASGSTFAGWSGAGCSGTGTCEVTMSQAQAVTATFDVSPASGGGSSSQTSNSTSGSTSGTTPAPTPTPTNLGVSIPDSLARTGLPVSADGTVGLPLECPPGIPGGCDASGVLSLRLPGLLEANGRKGEQASRTKVLARFRGVEIASGRKRLYSVRLAPVTYMGLRRAGVRRVPATLRIVNRLDNGTPVVTRERVWLRIVPLALPVTG